MLRSILLFVLITMIARAFWRVIDGVLDGLRRGPAVDGSSSRSPQSVQMVRDPVCGTFVVPTRAITLVAGGRDVHFCSTRCRDAFQAGGAVSAQGRSA